MVIDTNFTQAFTEASGGLSPWQYSAFIRFTAIMVLILAIMWTLQHFLSMEAKESEGFMGRLGSRLVRISIALTLFIIFLTV